MKAIVLAAMILLPSFAQAAGLKSADISADNEGPAMKAMIWTPCSQPAGKIALGPMIVSAVRNCPTDGKKLPLIVISHGHGGSNLNHHDLAETLADAGFVVAAVNHPGDNYADMSTAGEMANLIERPEDIERLIDYMLSKGADAQRIDGSRIGFFGFSRGGYTGLVLAGGNPDFIHANVPCEDTSIPLCAQIRRKEVPLRPFTHDPRIKAYVLPDPLNTFPSAGNLDAVQSAIQLWSSEFGGDGVLPGTGQALAAMLPMKPEFHFVAGSTHFAFLAPCSPQLAEAVPAICTDGKGFDRQAMHQALNASALAFYQEHL